MFAKRFSPAGALCVLILLATACSDDASPCPAGSTLCGDLCVNTRTDQQNCGACGTACDPGFVCDGAGTCALSCQAGLTACDGTCVDTQSDRASCGACGTACEDGDVCNGSGVCELSCQAGLVECDGKCIDPDTDGAFCGAAGDCEGDNTGETCGAGAVCNGAGVCEVSCLPGFVECGGGCVDPDTSRAFCGASSDCQGENAGTSCGDGFICSNGTCELSCQEGLVECGGKCIDPDTDRTFCGASGDCQDENAGMACEAGEVCNGSGQCELSCQAGLVECNGKCIDPKTDEAYCGAGADCSVDPGEACQAGQICDGTGQCAVTCELGFVECNGSCINPETDRTYCGAMADCEDANAGTTCQDGEICDGTGQCALSCQDGLVDCGGTCINPETDRLFCGAGPDCSADPGLVCGSGEICNAGACELSCQAGLVKCNGTCTDPMTDRTFCGAGPDCEIDPGETCADGFICDGAGVCALSCQAGLTECNGTCTDTRFDPNNCGGCGVACGDTQACAESSCQDLDFTSVVYVHNDVSPGSVSAFAVAPDGSLSSISGSPFATGGDSGFSHHPDGVVVCGTFLYAVNTQSSTIAGFEILPDGDLSSLAGSPFPSLGTTVSLACNESATFLYQSNFSDQVRRFSIDAAGALAVLGDTTVATSSLGMTYDFNFDRLFLANWASNLSSFNVDTSTGDLTPATGTPYAFGTRNHSAVVSPDGRFLAAEGTQQVHVLAVAADGSLSPVPGSPFADPANCETVGLAWSPSGNLLVAGHRNGCTPAGRISVYVVDTSTGVLTPAAESPVDTSGGQAVAVGFSPGGKYLYVGHRTGDVIDAFEVSADGGLTPVPGSPFANDVAGAQSWLTVR
jgi:6-phosphogluconolactonase (cycloisomerase 2 family)